MVKRTGGGAISSVMIIPDKTSADIVATIAACTDPEGLSELWQQYVGSPVQRNYFLQHAFAENPATPSNLLSAMVGFVLVCDDQLQHLAKALAGNPNLPLRWLLHFLPIHTAIVAANPALTLLFLEDATLLSSVIKSCENDRRFHRFDRHPSLAAALLGEPKLVITFNKLRKGARDAREPDAEVVWCQFPSEVAVHSFDICRWKRPGFGWDNNVYWPLEDILSGLNFIVTKNRWAAQQDWPLIRTLADLHELSDQHEEGNEDGSQAIQAHSLALNTNL